MNHHIARNGQQLGVFAEQDIQSGIASGQFLPDDLCWTEGMADWQPLSSRFQVTAPPAAGTVSQQAVFNPYAAPLANVNPGLPSGVQLADQGKRFGAALIDMLISSSVTGVPYAYFVIKAAKSGGKSLETSGTSPDELFALAIMILGMLVLLVINAIILTKRGQTLGKMCVGIRVVTFPDCQLPGFVKAVLLRLVVNAIICAMPCCIGFIYFIVDSCFVFSDNRRCVHDLIAGTQVIEGHPPKA